MAGKCSFSQINSNIDQVKCIRVSEMNSNNIVLRLHWIHFTRHTFIQGINIHSMEFHLTFGAQVDVTSQASTYILSILEHQLIRLLIISR